MKPPLLNRQWQGPPAPVDGAAGAGWRGVIADITEAQRFENRLRLQAEQDPLTGLANAAIDEMLALDSP